jgi:ankyrin repeat protein
MVQDPKTGNTALHISSQNGHLPLMQLLIAKSPNRRALVNSQNNLGQTALHMVRPPHMPRPLSTAT